MEPITREAVDTYCVFQIQIFDVFKRYLNAIFLGGKAVLRSKKKIHNQAVKWKGNVNFPNFFFFLNTLCHSRFPSLWGFAAGSRAEMWKKKETFSFACLVLAIEAKDSKNKISQKPVSLQGFSLLPFIEKGQVSDVVSLPAWFVRDINKSRTHICLFLYPAALLNS